MALSKEELLKPRIRVIAGWPQIKSMDDDVEIGKGDVLHEMDFGGNKWFVKDAAGLLAVHPTWVDKYPHLFQRIPLWHEGRSLKEMPKYLKDKSSGMIGPVKFKMKDGEWVTPLKSSVINL